MSNLGDKMFNYVKKNERIEKEETMRFCTQPLVDLIITYHILQTLKSHQCCNIENK